MADNVIYVKRNEKLMMMQELAGKYYNKEISWEEYNRRCDNIKEIPLDFSDYPQMSEKIQKMINAHAREEDITREGKWMLRGSYMSGMEYVDKYLMAFGIRNTYGDDLSGFGGNETDLIVFTWCEGDTTIVPCKTKEEYVAEMQKEIDWWNKER